jgi:phospholipase/carboxylesterase
VLHGWGANADDVASLIPFLKLSRCQFLVPDGPFPHPYNPPTGRMWYGFPENFSFQNSPEFANRPDLVSSRQQLTEWLKALPSKTGVPLSKTVLAGFSQGGAMTIDVGLNLPLAGLVVLSGYMHSPPELTAPKFPPVFMVHGRQDAVVPLKAAQQTQAFLMKSGVNVRYEEINFMGHEIQPLVLGMMQSFVSEVLALS